MRAIIIGLFVLKYSQLLVVMGLSFLVVAGESAMYFIEIYS